MPTYEAKSGSVQDAYRPATGDERMVVRSSSWSIASEKHPERNEDCAVVDDARGFYGVFDGMGGHAAGDRASRWAAEYIAHSVEGGYLDIADPAGLEQAMRNLLHQANRYVENSANRSFDTQGAGTTAVVAKFYRNSSGGVGVCIANVGDSRASLLRGGKLYPLTLDDSFYRGAENPWEAQRVLDNYDTTDDSLPGLPDNYKVAFRNRNVVSQALGAGVNDCHVYRYDDLRPGDKLVLTSDGIHDNLTTGEMEVVLQRQSSQGDPSKALCDEALRKSHTRSMRRKADDMTAVVVEVAGFSNVRAGREENRSFATQQTPGVPMSSERQRPKMMSEVKTVEDLWNVIGSVPAEDARQRLYRAAKDVLEGRIGLNSVALGDEFRRALERVGCRQFIKNMVRAGHTQVFVGADLKWGEEEVLKSMIDQFDAGLVGSLGRYSPEALKNIASEVLSGKASVIEATRTQGFRQALINMLEDREKSRQQSSTRKY